MRPAALLRVLDKHDLAFIEPHLHRHSVERGDVLFDKGKPVESVWFPESGLGSIVMTTPEGLRAENGLVGRGRFLPVSIVLGDDRSPHEGLMQLAGECLPFTVDSVNYPTTQAIKMICRATIASRQDSLFGMFADAETTACAGLALIYRTRTGSSVMQVEPCRPKGGPPMILVTTDRTKAFKLDEHQILTSVPVPPRMKSERGIERAREEIRASMRTAEN